MFLINELPFASNPYEYDCICVSKESVTAPAWEYVKCPTWQEQARGEKLYDVDFVLFVSALEDNCTKALAYASHCAIDPATRRPIAGDVNICPHLFEKTAKDEIPVWESVLKHELTHAFVFSPTLFTDFPGAGHLDKEKDLFVIPNVVDRFTRLDWESSNGVVKHDVNMVVTPRVREEARRHFNCSTLEGAELENYGSTDGTAGAHWEKRVFEDRHPASRDIRCCVLAEALLSVMETKMLRWTAGVTRLDHILNDVIRERFGVAPIVDKMREVRLRWCGERTMTVSIRSVSTLTCPESGLKGL
ncbi:hypothetical protein TELCIR_01435 [Teladorsagia circumcincta]|uniref:Leishmanolysin-like peptidase n=1 Tax=Teladorsagia circumcincta TaxID=45464 RepID=A0A2G9V1Y5_TELCI|nr:hypothetical protein TELCIR_01435 [Teladorsagia circumcincta]